MSNTDRQSLLGSWAIWAGTNPKKVFLLVFLITAVMITGTLHMKMEMTFYSIMPQKSHHVQDMKRITENYPFASTIIAVVDGRGLPETDAKASVKAAIDEMEMSFLSEEFSDAVSGVYSRVDLDFLKEHGFLLTEEKDLKRMARMYADPELLPFLTALNDDLEREYSGDGEAMDDDETRLSAWLGGLEDLLSLLADSLEGELPKGEMESAMDSYLLGESYYLSREENMGIIFINPTYTVNDLGPLVTQTNRIDLKVTEIARSRGLDAGITGFIVVGRDEMVTSEQGFALSMILALVLILLLMIAVFRMRSTPLIIGTPLFLGILWTSGMTGFLLHRLNIMTAMYMVALLGLGVDYAIHLMTGYVQERDRGQDFLPALKEAFVKGGKGVITGGLTTAAAFYALLMAESDLVRELAVVAGTGILCELLAMILFIPAYLGWRNGRLVKKGKEDPMLRRKSRIRSDFADGLGLRVTRRPGLWAGGLMVLCLALATQAPKVELEDNIMNMEAKGLKSIELQDVMTEEFGAAPDVLYVISDDRNELPEMVTALDDLDSVKDVSAITQWWPTEAQLQERRPWLDLIRSQLAGRPSGSAAVPAPGQESEIDPDLVLEELYRLEANLIEMGDLAVLGGSDRLAYLLNLITGLNMDGEKVKDSVFDRLFESLESRSFDASGPGTFQSEFSPLLTEKILRMASSGDIALEDLPPMIRDTFLSTTDDSTLVTIAPGMNPWEGEFRNIFSRQVATVTDRGTGMILAADQLIQIADSDGKKSMVAALIAVFIILLLDFRNLKLTVLTFIPLLMSFASLFGLMAVFGIKFDFVNIISIPLLVGIGIDDSVHINHRYLTEGKGQMHTALAGTGSAVALTTITTMIGFASFIPSIMRAMRSTGIVLTLAMALAFVYSVCFHPALIVLVHERLGWELKEWNPKSFGKFFGKRSSK